MGNAPGGVTNAVWDQLNRVYAELDKFINLVGLEYDGDEYICHNEDQVDPEWCDYEMLESIENAHADLGYFLGK